MSAEAGTLCERARGCFRDAVVRLDPAERVASDLARDPIDEPAVVVVAAGKAAHAMARGAADALGDRVAGGLVVAPEPGPGPAPGGVTALVAAHPVPDERSERAGRAALAQVAAAPANGRVLALISGGASALLCAPASGLSLADTIAATGAVMAAGAPIGDLNVVRKHLSAIKGGRLAEASAAPVTTLAASDVVGDPLAAIGSGPTVPDPSTFADAARAVERSCGWDAIPAAARAHIDAGRRGERQETPKAPRPGDGARVVAGTGALVNEAIAAAEARGFVAEELARDVEGDVAGVAGELARAAARAAERARALGRPVALVAGGEPTVRLPAHPGEGGRAHQLALLVARRIAGLDRVAVVAAGSDGIDGVSRGAGAVVTGATWAAIGRAGRDPTAALDAFDAAPALAAAGAQIVTGRTGVNHADVMLAVAEP